MSSMMETAVAAPAKPAAPVLARVLELKPQDSKLACATADGREFMLTRLIGSNVRIGDEVAVADSSGTATANTEVYIRKPSSEEPTSISSRPAMLRCRSRINEKSHSCVFRSRPANSESTPSTFRAP
jgi:hypothetical protein